MQRLVMTLVLVELAFVRTVNLPELPAPLSKSKKFLWPTVLPSSVLILVLRVCLLLVVFQPVQRQHVLSLCKPSPPLQLLSELVAVLLAITLLVPVPRNQLRLLKHCPTISEQRASQRPTVAFLLATFSTHLLGVPLWQVQAGNLPAVLLRVEILLRESVPALLATWSTLPLKFPPLLPL